MKLLKLFGIVFFCGLLSPSRGVLSGLSCAVSPGAVQKVLSDAVIQNGLLQKHLQGLVLPNIMGDGGLLNSPTSITGLHLVRVRLPKLSVALLPGIGVQLAIAARLDLSGNCCHPMATQHGFPGAQLKARGSAQEGCLQAAG
ncbi:Long palate, lung and nasal epithelium carcinoma-associated protein 4 [Aix galericulata]|nr:Long palate, lung and nasal epithelium carcinoma-associated protein 4 [Aix galericulata]